MKETLLKSLVDKTPSMLCVDGVKLLYQHHFGCGHLLAEQEKVAQRIRQEIASTDEYPDCAPAEFIGGGLCRLNLHHPLVRSLSSERIAAMMQITQEKHLTSPENSLPAFLKSLDLLKEMAKNGQTPFGSAALEGYLESYAREGYPMVSHSEVYRRQYCPAYRVVLSDFAVLLPLIARVEAKMRREGKALVIMDGPCGSGKTTLAGLLSQVFGAAPILPMDHFFLPPEMRTPQRLSQPGGNIHYERILSETMQPLIGGEAFDYLRFCCSDFTMEKCHIPAAPLRIVEGSYSLHPQFQAGWEKAGAITAYIEVDDAEQLSRIAARNPEMLDMFKSRWIPLEKKYRKAYDIIRWAELRLTSISWEAGA
ncbi:MAG: hypothetical protein E7331_01560 [Clostridiales bacterium]|nr:hypothetical protein [Clostridiales bacterium]